MQNQLKQDNENGTQY